MRLHSLVAVLPTLAVVLAPAGRCAAQGEPGNPGPAAPAATDGIHLEFQAPAGCPDEDAFLAELRTRTHPPASGRRVVGDLAVRLSLTSGGATATLEIRTRGKTVGSRTLAGRTCKDVVAAVALAAALDLEAIAEDAAEAAPPPVAPPPPPPPPRPPPPPPPPRARWSWRLALGAQASVTSGVVPGALFGVPLFAELGTRPRGPLSPSFRVWALPSLPRSADELASLRFTWLVGGLDVCPVRLGWPVLGIRPCARVAAGTLRATPERVPLGVSFDQEVTRPWVSAGGVARAEWEPSPLLFFEIEGAAFASVVREQLVFVGNGAASVLVYRVPPAGLSAGAGLGVHFL
jgi:hypothetical protein